MKKRNVFLITTLASCFTFFVTFFTFKKFNRSLVLRKLVDKNTKILNIYTRDYVENNVYTKAKDIKDGFESFVYTDNAKDVCNFDIFSDEIVDENLQKEKEKKQIISFVKELSKIATNPTIVIHVYSDKVANEYVKYFSFLKEDNYCKIKILKNAVSSDNFVEE